MHVGLRQLISFSYERLKNIFWLEMGTGSGGVCVPRIQGNWYNIEVLTICEAYFNGLSKAFYEVQTKTSPSPQPRPSDSELFLNKISLLRTCLFLSLSLPSATITLAWAKTMP